MGAYSLISSNEMLHLGMFIVITFIPASTSLSMQIAN